MRRLRPILFVAFALSIVGYIAWDRVEAVRLSRLVAAIQARREPVSVDYWEARRRTPALLPSVPIDPLSAEPLVYRSDSGGYVIYRVDSNRRDDHGAIYGHGSAVAVHVGPQSPRDFGIRVPLEGTR
jgi:hypothetical protein